MFQIIVELSCASYGYNYSRLELLLSIFSIVYCTMPSAGCSNNYEEKINYLPENESGLKDKLDLWMYINLGDALFLHIVYCTMPSAGCSNKYEEKINDLPENESGLKHYLDLLIYIN